MLRGSWAFQAKFIGRFSPKYFQLWLLGSLGRRLVVKVGTSKIMFLHSSTSDCQDLLGRRLVARVGTSKGSTISHMAAVHPGHLLPGALQKEEDEEMITM